MQFILLTATCPPTLMTDILTTLAIRNCRVIRAPTDRPEISYNVKMWGSVSEAKQKLISAVRERIKGSSSTFRCLVYCRGKKSTEEIAKILGCNPFHSDRPEEERKASFMDWVEGRNKVIVSTSLLGCGIDVEGVEAVYHFMTPRSLMDFAQESGRAGRGGAPAESWVFSSEEDYEPDTPTDLFGYEIMKKWVHQTSLCRRIDMSSFLDGRVTTCTLTPKANLCDVCDLKSNEPHPRRPVRLG